MTQKVLLVDDDKAVREALGQTLDLAGFDVLPAASFIEATDYISPEFDGVVISDVRMPGKDGFSMFADMRQQGRQPDRGKQIHYLGLMVSESERLTRLINNVLDFSQLEEGGKRYAKAPLDLGRLCREMVDGQRIRLGQNGFSVQLSCPEDSELWIEGDPEAFKQVLLNLLANAEKYSPNRREIEVVCGREGQRASLKM